MSTITQGTITFSNVYKDGGTKHGDTIIQSTYNSSAATPSDANFPLVNAVDIDWNGAVLPNGDITNGSPKTINTTGELLSLINSMSEQIITLNKQVYALGAAVIAIGSNPALQTN